MTICCSKIFAQQRAIKSAGSRSIHLSVRVFDAQKEVEFLLNADVVLKTGRREEGLSRVAVSPRWVIGVSAVGSDDSRLNGKRGLNVQIESKYHLTINGQWLLNREPFYKIYPGKIIQVTAHAVHVGNALLNLLDRVWVGNSSVRYILDFVLYLVGDATCRSCRGWSSILSWFSVGYPQLWSLCQNKNLDEVFRYIRHGFTQRGVVLYVQTYARVYLYSVSYQVLLISILIVCTRTKNILIVDNDRF